MKILLLPTFPLKLATKQVKGITQYFGYHFPDIKLTCQDYFPTQSCGGSLQQFSQQVCALHFKGDHIIPLIKIFIWEVENNLLPFLWKPCINIAGSTQYDGSIGWGIGRAGNYPVAVERSLVGVSAIMLGCFYFAIDIGFLTEH
ncbi:hypothetical protein CEXT_409091 [Caerostris extrusa]|uniref:Uncharacterized protein n=1 Tax=Caerostris extrusa TaxID=172846 RepID=A0AAV4XVI0_CAEEX|nr:hypothetical protein CEXT_409091 [Caerostris extrusa]